MADVCQVTGTIVDLTNENWSDGALMIQRVNDATVPGNNDISIGQPIPIVTNASGVLGHIANGSFVAGFDLVRGHNYIAVATRTDVQTQLPAFRLSVPSTLSSANIATLLVTDPVPPLDQATQAVIDALMAASAAAASATAAAGSATAAGTSATNAASSATAAATSATAAGTSATNAATSATNAASSATAAGTSETNAATSATNAGTSETNAATSATNAATSATNAGTSETNAASSATAAAASASDAAGFVGQDLFATSSTSASRTVVSNTFAVPSSGAADLTITTSGSTATLNTITGAANNKYILIRPASGKTITLTHSLTASNGFVLNGADVVLSAITDNVLLRYTGSRWIALGGSALLSAPAGGGGGVWAAIGGPSDVSGISGGVTFTGFDAATYVDYRFIYRSLLPANNAFLRIATSSDGGDSYDTTAGDYRSDIGVNSPALISRARNHANSRINGTLEIFNPGDSSSFTGMIFDSTTYRTSGTQNLAGEIYRTEAAVVNAVRFDLTSGGFTSGEIQMEGRLIAT